MSKTSTAVRDRTIGQPRESGVIAAQQAEFADIEILAALHIRTPGGIVVLDFQVSRAFEKAHYVPPAIDWAAEQKCGARQPGGKRCCASHADAPRGHRTESFSR